MKIFLFTLTISLISCLVPSQSLSTAEGERISKYLEKLVKSGYDKNIRPESTGGPDKPINVSVTMYILDITKIDEVNMEYRAQFYFRQAWMDTRLAYTDQDIDTIVLKDAKYVWTPDLFFIEEREGIHHSLTNPNVFLRISKDGEIFLSVRVSITFRCPMDFRKYPHDTQKCTFGVESFAFNNKFIQVQWGDHKGKSVGIDYNMELLPFRVTDIQEDVKHEIFSTGEYTTLQLELTFQRKAGLFIGSLYLPFSFLVVLSWLSFWIPAKLLAPRLSLLLVILYLMVNIGEDMNDDAPKSSYTKASDVWIAVCETLVFASFLEFIVVHILAKNKDSQRKELCQNNPESECVLNSDAKINSISNEPSSNTMKMIANRLKSDPMLPNSIEKISSILFPVLFIVFNFIYWIVYCTGN